MKHQKHKKLTRPDWGVWGRNEWAIVGGKCSDIQSISRSIMEYLGKTKSLYIDADHKSHHEGSSLAYDTYTDKIGYYEWATDSAPSKFTTRPMLANYNLILVNGNHHQANRQIVILDREKEGSLKKRLHQLSQIDIVLMHKNRDNQSFDFFEKHLSESNQNPIRIEMDDIESIANYIESKIQVAPLKALLLVGGKSQRMGSDKAKIDYHGKPQYQYIHDLLVERVHEVYISCRKDQVDQYAGYQTIADTFDNLGPLGGILSAFRSDPNAAWLVLACDLPMLTVATINQLIDERNPMAAGTAFKSTFSEWMEPLISIYEPSIYPTALQLLGQGYSCARKVMINAPTHIINAKNTDWLTNVNTPEERSNFYKINK